LAREGCALLLPIIAVAFPLFKVPLAVFSVENFKKNEKILFKKI